MVAITTSNQVVLVRLRSVLLAPGGAVFVDGLLFGFGLAPLQIFPVKLFGNRAHVTILPNRLNLHFPVKLLVEAQGHFLSHWSTYICI